MPRYIRTVEYTTRDIRYELQMEGEAIDILGEEEDGEVMRTEARWWDENDNEITGEEYARLENLWQEQHGEGRD